MVPSGVLHALKYGASDGQDEAEPGYNPGQRDSNSDKALLIAMIASLAAVLLWLAQANASPVVRDAAVSFNIASGTPASINDPAPVGIS